MCYYAFSIIFSTLSPRLTSQFDILLGNKCNLNKSMFYIRIRVGRFWYKEEFHPMVLLRMFSEMLNSTNYCIDLHILQIEHKPSQELKSFLVILLAFIMLCSISIIILQGKSSICFLWVGSDKNHINNKKHEPEKNEPKLGKLPEKSKRWV